MKIAILGAGSVGGALGRCLAAAGHQIHYGVPDPQSRKVQALVNEFSATAGTVAEAARDAAVVILATPYTAAPQALREAGDLTGKIIVDATNPLRMGAEGLELTAGYDISGAEQIAALVPQARVCKAFNQTGFANMEQPEFDGKPSVMFVCGDDAEALAVVCQLSDDIGFETVNAGNLRVARLLEPLALLWIHLSAATALKRDFAFGLLRR